MLIACSALSLSQTRTWDAYSFRVAGWALPRRHPLPLPLQNTYRIFSNRNAPRSALEWPRASTLWARSSLSWAEGWRLKWRLQAEEAALEHSSAREVRQYVCVCVCVHNCLHSRHCSRERSRKRIPASTLEKGWHSTAAICSDTGLS